MPVLSRRINRPVEHRWTVAEFERLADDGFFHDQQVELIDGKVIVMPPMKEPHATGVEKARRALDRVFGHNVWIRVQMPLHLGRRNAPYPDLAVVTGEPGSYATAPTTAQLVVEVADTSLAHDRRKSALYAGANIADYWILNLVDRQVEVFRNPVAIASGKRRAGYASASQFGPGDAVAPLAAPKSPVKVADLLP